MESEFNESKGNWEVLLTALRTIANSEQLETDTFVCDFETLQNVAIHALTKVGKPL